MEKGKIYKQSSIHSSSTKAANSAFTTPRRPEEDLKVKKRKNLIEKKKNVN
jgi:hypothetical protein